MLMLVNDQRDYQVSQAYVTEHPMDFKAFTALAVKNGYKLAPKANHPDLAYVAGIVFKARGQQDIPVWETTCADKLTHIETFRPPSFIAEWVFEGDGNYGEFCGEYEDEDEDEDED